MNIYQVLPRCWGKGKFSDWKKAAFDYVKGLGMDTIWFTGVPRHSTAKPYVKGNCGSPYSILDYRDVNPYLADDPASRMKEFEALLRRAHNAGLRVLIDLVPNHVSPDNTQLPLCPYCDYDWTDTRKIDYSNREAWGAMLEIVRFWAKKGVDGMRCDMVEMVPPEFLRFLISSVKADFPSFTFVAEVYTPENYRKYVEYVGFDLLYDKSGSYDLLRGILCGYTTAESLTANWQRLGDLQPHMLNFLENHDEQRLASPQFASDPARGYASLAFSALFNGASFMLYSGQELGEDAADGADGRSSIFDMVKVPSVARLLSGSLRPSESAVLQRYREILTNLPFVAGMQGWDLCYCQAPTWDTSHLFAFARYDGTRALVCLCNFSGVPYSGEIIVPQELRSRCPAFSGVESVKVNASAWDADIIKY